MPSESSPARRWAALGETHNPQDLVHPTTRDLVRVGEPVQMVAGPPSGVSGVGVEERANLVQREAKRSVGSSADRDHPRRRYVERDNHAHRGRLAASVRAEEPSDLASLDREAQIVNRGSCRSAWIGAALQSPWREASSTRRGRESPGRGPKQETPAAIPVVAASEEPDMVAMSTTVPMVNPQPPRDTGDVHQMIEPQHGERPDRDRDRREHPMGPSGRAGDDNDG